MKADPNPKDETACGVDAPDAYDFRLYISGPTAASARAVVNTRRFCEQHLPGRYRLHILNLSENVALATADEIIAAPTLIRLSPLPVRRFIGDMSNVTRLLSSLGVDTPVAQP